MRFGGWTRVFGVLATLGLLSAEARSTRAQSVHDARGEALRLYAQGRYREALPLMNQVLARKSRDLDLLNKRGCIYLRMNQPARALEDFNLATRYNPFLAYDEIDMFRQYAPDVQYNPPASYVSLFQVYVSPYTNRGIALMMLGRDDDALAAFQHSILIHEAQPPTNGGRYAIAWRAGMATAFGGIGQVLHRKGDDDRALTAYDRAAYWNPDDPNVHVGRGEALVGLGQFDKALASYGQALRLDPKHSRAYGFRAAALERLGQDAAALADYDAAIKLDPSAAMVRRMRAALLSRLGRHEQAAADVDAALRVDPADAGALKDRGGIANRLGDHARALRDLDESIRLDPKNSRAFQNRAAAYNGLKQFDRAIADCDAALKLDPRNAGALNNRGLALASLGRFERAVADLTESIRLDPLQVPAYFNRGGAYARLGLLENAARDYEEVVRLAPEFAPASAGLAQVRETLARRPESSRDDMAVWQEPTAAEKHRDLGDARRSAGDWAGAIAEYTRALESDPKDADALASRGWSRAIAGAPGAEADARAWFDRKGWRDPFAPYMALLGVLAARQDGHDPAAAGFLDEALANTRLPDWPAPLFRYLKRTLSATDLVAAAADAPDKVADARAVIGLDLLARGERDAALDQLRWVRDHGSDRSIARDLARESLRRIEATPPAPAESRPGS